MLDKILKIEHGATDKSCLGHGFFLTKEVQYCGSVVIGGCIVLTL